MTLSKETIVEVVNFCNRDLVPDEKFDSTKEFYNEWFINSFSFLGNEEVESKLGEAFYEARFLYKLMAALRLPLGKQKGIVKFQIIQYASICEALIDLAITKFFKKEAEEQFGGVELRKCDGVLHKDVEVKKGTEKIFMCVGKKFKGDLKRTRIDEKTKFAYERGIISSDVKDKFNELYDLRNNVHVLKAATNQYVPKIKESREAFTLTEKIIEEIKDFYAKHSEMSSGGDKV